MEERVGFEPTAPCGAAVFKTAALNRSATSPYAESSLLFPFQIMAERVGFEPTAPLRVQRSSETAALNRSATSPLWCSLKDSNLRPLLCESSALPLSLKGAWRTRWDLQPTSPAMAGALAI